MRPTLKTLMCAWRRHGWLQGGSDAPCHSYSGSDNGTLSESWRLYCEEGRAVLGPESRKIDIFAELSESDRVLSLSEVRAGPPVHSNDSIEQLKLQSTLDWWQRRSSGTFWACKLIQFWDFPSGRVRCHLVRQSKISSSSVFSFLFSFRGRRWVGKRETLGAVWKPPTGEVDVLGYPWILDAVTKPHHFQLKNLKDDGRSFSDWVDRGLRVHTMTQFPRNPSDVKIISSFSHSSLKWLA